MIQRLYNWTMSLSVHPRAQWVLGGVSFLESSIFPIPPDVLLVPMVLADRNRAWRLALICTVASVFGGFLGYGIGYYFFEQVGKPLIEFYGYAENFNEFQEAYNEWGLWLVIIAGVTPFPYKMVTIMSGVTALDPVTFLISSLLGRGLRFFPEAGMLWFFGEPIRAFIERRLQLLVVLLCILLFGGFMVAKFVL